MNWIESKKFDLIWIISPGFISVFFVTVLHILKLAPQTTSPIYWLIFVVFVDVAHVWSTIFRTYLNKDGIVKYQKQLWLVPIACYCIGVFIYSFGALIFWRVLAYIAVFHFVRQQYGFFQIYSRKDSHFESRFSLFDKISIYSVTIVPMIIWHLSVPGHINWFVEGDFLHFENKELIPLVTFLGIFIVLLYYFKELFYLKNSLLAPKNLFLLVTFLVWWTGIVWIKSDWSFTITNVVSHGIPYFALIYLSDLKNREKIFWPQVLPTITIFIFLLGLGFFEEALWDVFIWDDHAQIFSLFKFMKPIENSDWLTLIVPALTLPQATHYILDGYIWKKSGV